MCALGTCTFTPPALAVVCIGTGYDLQVYDINCSSPHTVPITASVVACERNKDETKLLLGCEDGTLVSTFTAVQWQFIACLT